MPVSVEKDFRVKNGLIVVNTLTVLSTSQSLSSTTGAVVISGGLGVAKNLYVGGNLTVSGTVNASITGISSTATNIANGSQGQLLYQSSSGITAFVNSGTSGQFLQATTNGAPVFTNTSSIYVGSSANSDNARKLLTARTITLSGDLSGNVSFDGSTDVNLNATIAPNSVTLGVDTVGNYLASGATSGFGLNFTGNGEGAAFNVTSNATSSNTLNTIVYRDGNGNFSASGITLTGTTAASSTNSGALQVAGGVGIGGALYIGTSSYIFGAQILTSATVNQFVTAGVSSVSAGTDTAVSQSTGAVVIWNTSTLQSITNRGATTTNTISITNTTTAISTNSGALQVRGGVGIGGKLFVGGMSQSTSSVIVYYNSSTGEVSYGPSFASGGGGTTSPFNGIFTITNTTAATSTSSGALQVNGGVGIGGNLYASGLFANGTQISGFNSQEFTSLAGQSVFTVTNGYIVGQVEVFANGISLNASDFTASNGSSITLTEARRLNDIVKIVSGKNIGISPQQAYIFTEVVATSTGQTTFTANYNTATLQVFIDGVLRSPTTYTASNGTSIVLSNGSGIVNGTRMGVLSFNSISVVGAVSLSGGTVNGTLNVNGSLQQNGTDIKAYALAMAAAMGI